MDFLELAEMRYSVRKFSAEEVGEADIAKILRAAQLAPTACNNQPQRILTVNTRVGLDKLRKCAYFNFGETLAFIVCYDKDACWTRSFDGKPSGDIDASIAATHMILEAANLGLGSTWVMHFIPEAVREEFQLPDNYVPVALLPMGRPAKDAAPAPAHSASKPIDELAFSEKFR